MFSKICAKTKLCEISLIRENGKKHFRFNSTPDYSLLNFNDDIDVSSPHCPFLLWLHQWALPCNRKIILNITNIRKHHIDTYMYHPVIFKSS